jgi:hypothetical protein
MVNEKIIHTKKDYRSFGIIVGAIFLLVFGLALPYWKAKSINQYFSIGGLALIAIAVVLPILLKYPYLVWMKIGEVLGFINTRIILSIIFYILFTPFGIIRRIIGKDTLGVKLHPEQISYRKISAQTDINHMERPF